MRTVIAVAGVLAGSLGVLFAAPQAGAAPGPCPGASGVTVVVDFGAFGGGVEVGCAPGDPSTGYAALVGADFDVQGASRSPSFLCRIDGQPDKSLDLCIMPPPATAYWSYWIADRGKDWCYSSAGMSGRDPQPGTVEGWSFVRGSGAGGTAAPRSSTFTPVAGGGSTGVDCDAATTATTAAPRATVPRSSVAPGTTPRQAAPAPAGPGVDPGTGVAPGGGQPAAPGATTTTPTVTSQTTTAPSTSAVAGADTTTSSTEPTDGEHSSDDTAPDGDDGDSEGDSEEALSTVTLADSGRSGPGGPLGTALALGTVAAVAAGAVVVNRRRFRVSADALSIEGVSGDGVSGDGIDPTG